MVNRTLHNANHAHLVSSQKALTEKSPGASIDIERPQVQVFTSQSASEVHQTFHDAINQSKHLFAISLLQRSSALEKFMEEEKIFLLLSIYSKVSWTLPSFCDSEWRNSESTIKWKQKTFIE
jgi:hypothetical protein